MKNNIPETQENWFTARNNCNEVPANLTKISHTWIKVGCTVYMLMLNTWPGVIKQCMWECKHQDLEWLATRLSHMSTTWHICTNYWELFLLQTVHEQINIFLVFRCGANMLHLHLLYKTMFIWDVLTLWFDHQHGTLTLCCIPAPPFNDQ